MPDQNASDPFTPQTLVDILRAGGHLTDSRVDAAFSRVPRHAFLPGKPLEQVYSDQSVPVALDEAGSATVAETMPSLLASLLTASHVVEGQNVLHIGTGTGYSSALLSAIVGTEGKVTSIEIERDVAENAKQNLLRAGYSSVNVVHSDGADGYAPRAAYDRILSNVGVWDVPPAWIRQLKPGGMIVAPIWLDGLQVIASFRIEADGSLVADQPRASAFVYIRGSAAMPAVRQRVSSTALTLISDGLDRLDSASLHMLLSQDHDMENHLSLSLKPPDFWHGFLPYLSLNEPPEDVFALYTIDIYKAAYGMDGEGFVLFTPASACFVPYTGGGATHTFAGSDAFIDIERYLTAWDRAGRPGLDQLRLRLIPRRLGFPVDIPGKVYPRRIHLLHVWMEAPEANPKR